jgi:1-acyl-sn-glycerol-3-phosphate acyltransferase
MTAVLVALVVVLLLLFVGTRCVAADWGSFWLNGLLGLNRLFCLHYHRLADEPLPVPGGRAALLAANHTAGLDPMLIVAVSPRPIRFLVDREEYERFGLQWIFRAMGCIPVTMDGNPQRSFYDALKRLAQGEIVAIFPQGGLHPLGRLKRGVAKLAALSGIPITPIRISGVGSPGHVLLSVIVSGRARLEIGDEIRVPRDGEQEALKKLTSFLVSQPPG